jgi:hypothetical protein
MNKNSILDQSQIAFRCAQTRALADREDVPRTAPASEQTARECAAALWQLVYEARRIANVLEEAHK